jgi:hypothetical protein
VDRFSPAFEQLNQTFDKVQSGGAQAARSLDGLEGSASAVAAGIGQTAEAVAGFGARTAEDLAALTESQAAALEQMSQRHEQVSGGLAERLLALQAGWDARRVAQEQQTNARMEQERSAHGARMAELTLRQGMQALSFQAASLEAQLSGYLAYHGALLTLAQTQGRALAQTAKALAVSQALIETYLAANEALAQVPYPLNFLAAAAVTAQGLANVQRIQQVNIAHGGLSSVPDDATFLLRQGERVLAPRQNQDLTEFLRRQPEASTAPPPAVQNLTVHVLENATSAQALLAMDPAQLRQLVAERIIPAIDELARLGIRPRFIGSNT